jgi:hypothetical protein
VPSDDILRCAASRYISVGADFVDVFAENCFICSLSSGKGDESVTSINCLTEKQDHSDITEATHIHSTVSNTALSLIQKDTTLDNEKIKQFSANTSTKSAPTDIYLDAATK